MLQRVLFHAKVIFSKIIYWEEASWLLQLVHLREKLPFVQCRALPEVRGTVSTPWRSCCLAAAWAWPSVSEAGLPQSKADRPLLLHPNPDCFSLLCSMWHRAQFIQCVVSFPSRPSQSSNIFLHCDLRLYPHCTLKQVWKPVLVLEVERQLGHFTQHLASLAPRLVPCAIIITLREDFFPAKNTWNMWRFLRVFSTTFIFFSLW